MAFAALEAACATAAVVTGDPAWHVGLRQSVDWFLGANDIGEPMWDPATGGGYDGLTLRGPNLNQGAEFTLALISTLQYRSAQARVLASPSPDPLQDRLESVPAPASPGRRAHEAVPSG